MEEGASRCSFLFKAPYGTSAELCKWCREGPGGKRGASGGRMDRRMDGWMEEAELARGDVLHNENHLKAQAVLGWDYIFNVLSVIG